MQKTENKTPKRFNPFSQDFRDGERVGTCVDVMLAKIDTVRKLCPIAGTQDFCPNCSLSSPSN